MHVSNWKKKPLEVLKEINSPRILDEENYQFYFVRRFSVV